MNDMEFIEKIYFKTLKDLAMPDPRSVKKIVFSAYVRNHEIGYLIQQRLNDKTIERNAFLLYIYKLFIDEDSALTTGSDLRLRLSKARKISDTYIEKLMNYITKDDSWKH